MKWSIVESAVFVLGTIAVAIVGILVFFAGLWFVGVVHGWVDSLVP